MADTRENISEADFDDPDEADDDFSPACYSVDIAARLSLGSDIAIAMGCGADIGTLYDHRFIDSHSHYPSNDFDNGVYERLGGWENLTACLAEVLQKIESDTSLELLHKEGHLSGLVMTHLVALMNAAMLGPSSSTAAENWKMQRQSLKDLGLSEMQSVAVVKHALDALKVMGLSESIVQSAEKNLKGNAVRQYRSSPSSPHLKHRGYHQNSSSSSSSRRQSPGSLSPIMSNLGSGNEGARQPMCRYGAASVMKTGKLSFMWSACDFEESAKHEAKGHSLPIRKIHTSALPLHTSNLACAESPRQALTCLLSAGDEEVGEALCRQSENLTLDAMSLSSLKHAGKVALASGDEKSCLQKYEVDGLLASLSVADS
ncbi:hypothetical protein CEUSTIGMA_g6651.t1 [Chlamydomonas eustigma]|uniref:Uncharacterized protein n=1 Tax=Chlamydomonas eustigma TaxID=1157962 RepID=A0A250X803_9CHLO|nr:hypothetical protein CEUSTIGMA_g6651.t1 [Chlamydomonas eustigma]|eukprot:GAX79211.1 hypothetical protein CEUSTIGMA_g6651.t1 [Chlamydomonas eustigma]